MNLDKHLSIEKVLEILEEQVFQHTGRCFLDSERAVIVGTWDGKDYKEIARDSGYDFQYLRTGVAPQLWSMLTEVIGEGVQVKKIYLKKILLKIAKKHYLHLEASKVSNDSLVGKTIIYGELPKLNFFYGREEDISYLKKQINLFKRRCIALIGLGGIGKSFLAAKLVEELLLENSNAYNFIFWITINHCLSIDDLITEILNVLNLEAYNESIETKIYLILKQLNSNHCLLVLDGFESLAQVDNYEIKLKYKRLFIKLTQEQHQSYIIVTSQIPLEEIAHSTTSLPIVSLRVEGLEESAALEMLHEKGLGGDECKRLIDIYRGNPSELESVADRIHRFFGGSVRRFLEYRTTAMGHQFQLMLHQQFGQPGLLTDLQRQVMIYLAEHISENSIPISFSKLIEGLKEKLDIEISVSELIVATEILEQRSLIEVCQRTAKQEVSYNLEPVIKKYILVDPFGLVWKKSGVQTTSYFQE
ncbi:NACHT domain-containing protein [Nostoc sp. KVJ3]|uniref:ATP-binding protein n=1 Tax=Nostoc sp. KVJ3 TaxID=457945 RepID=UPI0022379458|nr:ATP-binding protein [Nostoc sp. KVJ3]MCW5318763.1 NACHT domain-containing protein [Nostoc sp. KVJ3]